LTSEDHANADGSRGLPQGQLGYLQIPATDSARAAGFYAAVLGWQVEPGSASFEAPGLIGQWVVDRPPAPGAGPVIWVHVDDLDTALRLVRERGGAILEPPSSDGPTRMLATISDSEGNELGLVQFLPIS
jgi:predicted enzyme related to lactoylglutathione lyase